MLASIGHVSTPNDMNARDVTRPRIQGPVRRLTRQPHTLEPSLVEIRDGIMAMVEEASNGDQGEFGSDLRVVGFRSHPLFKLLRPGPGDQKWVIHRKWRGIFGLL